MTGSIWLAGLKYASLLDIDREEYKFAGKRAQNIERLSSLKRESEFLLVNG